ncbi:MAG: hypothetical protein HOE48_18105 [Candidatus Latescibacteria bacterium]|nr:hypothetical protein [Candidatus Latescibacterota bacterium]
MPSTEILEHTFTVAKPTIAPTTHVSQIYPTSNTLPENLLKFYIYFSAPMQRDQTYSHIRLLDQSGKEISDPFLEVTPELWSPRTQRFTLFFDPGRIKRGLMPNQDLGLALKEGNTYHLVVSSSLKDANNNRLTAAYTKTFTIRTADRTSPTTKIWRITPPTKKTHEPLVLKLDEPLDHALLHRLIEIKNPKEQTLAGKVEITHNETRWHFTPQTPWASGPHTVHINPILEDVAGNQLTRLFDMNLENQTAQITSSDPIVLPFQIP